ncbi:hypothetical protein [Myceligenerans salitolerans]|uniref:Glyoxalase-like domain-containing protein n=1 Tax=Myceligenerans salitolerans TaxID=1230528 RepID=A0ABS3IEC0_9MICO|nr:hypothetical protein [Myceligenerans salitolerans]MBO0611318.1 hypothetical protein [Myceligenerans salitolerans]
MAFYDDFRAAFPDSGPGSRRDDTPWASAPLGLGIDHVSMNLRHGPAGDVIGLILELAAHHDLVIYDPQSDEVTRPTG